MDLDLLKETAGELLQKFSESIQFGTEKEKIEIKEIEKKLYDLVQKKAPVADRSSPGRTLYDSESIEARADNLLIDLNSTSHVFQAQTDEVALSRDRTILENFGLHDSADARFLLDLSFGIHTDESKPFGGEAHSPAATDKTAIEITAATGSPLHGNAAAAGSPLDGNAAAAGSPLDGNAAAAGSPLDGNAAAAGSPLDGNAAAAGSPLHGNAVVLDMADPDGARETDEIPLADESTAFFPGEMTLGHLSGNDITTPFVPPLNSTAKFKEDDTNHIYPLIHVSEFDMKDYERVDFKYDASCFIAISSLTVKNLKLHFESGKNAIRDKASKNAAKNEGGDKDDEKTLHLGASNFEAVLVEAAVGALNVKQRGWGRFSGREKAVVYALESYLQVEKGLKELGGQVPAFKAPIDGLSRMRLNAIRNIKAKELNKVHYTHNQLTLVTLF